MEKIFQPDMPLLTDRFLKTLMLSAIFRDRHSDRLILPDINWKTSEVLLKFKHAATHAATTKRLIQ
jgi:hypothetical protein